MWRASMYDVGLMAPSKSELQGNGGGISGEVGTALDRGSYSQWAYGAGAPPLKQKILKDRIKDWGLKKEKIGLRLSND